MKKSILALLLFTGVAGGICYNNLGDRDTLAKLVEHNCHPDDHISPLSLPCLRSNDGHGYVILKDRKGSAHYLLLPTRELTGIESPELLSRTVPNYFDLAWMERHFVGRNGRAVPDEMLLLAVNSKRGRSQDLLHIHISCIRPDVRRSLDDVVIRLDNEWRPVPVELANHQYWMRRVTADDLKMATPFEMAESGLARARGDMGDLSLALTATKGGFLLLATRSDLFDLNFASAGELQDYDCAGSEVP